MKATYQLKLDKSRKKSAIVLQCCINSRMIQYHVGISVEPKQWSQKNHKIYSGVKDAETNNQKLEEIRSAAMKEWQKCFNDNKPFTLEHLKQFLDNKFKTQEKEPEYIEEFFIKYIEDKYNRVGEKRYAKYKTLYKHLIDIQNHYKIKITYSDLNEKFYFQFIDYFIDVLKQVNRSVKESHLKVLNSFINWSVNKGHLLKNPYKNIKFPYHVGDADTISLSESELNTLAKHHITDLRLDRIRDIFCLQCYIGLRFSDMNKILPENLKSNYLELYTQKTVDKLRIPLLPEALKIINKYLDNEISFPSLSNQKANEYIKELCEIAGINEPVSILKISGLSRTTQVYKKHELVGTHTARRTFVTLSLSRGMNPFDIMKITGQKDIKTFLKYYRLDMAKVFENFFNAYSIIKPAYPVQEIVSNLIKLKVDRKIIAEAFGIEVESTLELEQKEYQKSFEYS